MSASVHAGIHTPTGTPPRQVHTPHGQVHPRQVHSHHDGHCSGQYASYWNAFLFSSRYFMICIITACEGCFHRCLSVHGGGVSASGPRGGVPDTPSPGQTPLHTQTTPLALSMLGYDQQAGGTHPTGVHSC